MSAAAPQYVGTQVDPAGAVELSYLVVRRGTGRKARRAMRFAARRVVKRVATCPRSRLDQLTTGLRAEWQRKTHQPPAYTDGWLMRTLGFLFLWGEGADILGVA